VATRERTPVTISGLGTGTVGGRVPFVASSCHRPKLNHIKSIVRDDNGGRAVAEAGVILRELQRVVDAEGLLYPPIQLNVVAFSR